MLASEYKYLNGIATKELESTLPRLKDRVLEPHKVSVDEDLREGAKEVEEQMRARIEELLDPELLDQFAIGDKEAEALQKSKISSSGLISIESTKTDNKKEKPSGFDKSAKKRGNDKHSSRSNKKRRA